MTPAERPVSDIGRGRATETGGHSMKVCVTGATGFVGAHVAATLVRARRRGAGHGPRPAAAARRSTGLDVEVGGRRRARPALDAAGARRAATSCSTPPAWSPRGPGAQVWRVNAVAPRIAVEAAAERGVRPGGGHLERGVDRAGAGRPGGHRAQPLPGRRARACSTRTPSTRASAAALGAGERLGIEVVSVCPSYVLGPAYNRGAAGRDLDPDRGQLPARPAAGDRRRLHEHRRRRGRRRRATCWPPSAGGRASATSSAARTCAGPR